MNTMQFFTFKLTIIVCMMRKKYFSRAKPANTAFFSRSFVSQIKVYLDIGTSQYLYDVGE